MRILIPVVFLLLSGQQEKAPESSWNQFRGSDTGTGQSATKIPDDLTLLWTFNAGFSIDSSAAIVDSVVYVTALPGLIAALNLSDGSIIWERNFGDSEDLFGESSPLVYDGVVYVGDLLGELHAFDSSNGNTLWTFQTEAEIKSSPVVFDDLLLIASYDEHLYAIDRHSGIERWRFQSMGPIHSTPVRDGKLVFITGCDSILRGIRLKDGVEEFQIDSGAYTASSPALMEGVAYYGTFNNDVLAIDVREQKFLWRYEHPVRHFPFYSSAAVSNDTVVVGGRDKIIHGIDRKTGEGFWEFRTGARVESSPAISRSRVYIGSADGKLYVLDLTNGKKLWEFNAGAPLVASPALASERVVIGSQDGVLYCFGAE